MTEGAVPELRDDLIELAADAAHLALGDPRLDAQRGDQVVDLARRDAVDVGLHDDRPQRPVDASPGFQQRGEEGARAQLRDAQLHVARLGREQPGAAPVALGDAAVGPFVARRADRLARLQLDEFLKDECHRLAHDVLAAAGADGVKQLGQGRL